VCTGEPIDPHPCCTGAAAEPGRWHETSCWVPGTRQVLNPVPVFPGCDDLGTVIHMCDRGSAVNCLGAGRLLELAAHGATKEALTYYQRACDFGDAEGCRRAQDAAESLRQRSGFVTPQLWIR